MMEGEFEYETRVREFEGKEPSRAVCPQCQDFLLCTNGIGEGYCVCCDVVWTFPEIREMMEWDEDEPTPMMEKVTWWSKMGRW